MTELQTEISGYEMQLAFSFDDIQIAKYTQYLADLYPIRDAYQSSQLEQEGQREGIMWALTASQDALDISQDLALGTRDAYERVQLSSVESRDAANIKLLEA